MELKPSRMIAISFLVVAGVIAGALFSKHLAASPRAQQVDPQEAADLAALATSTVLGPSPARDRKSAVRMAR